MLTAVDTGLERMLRAYLPLPEHAGDVSFEPPDGTWGAQLSRITVNLFLFDVRRSSLPHQPAAERIASDGRVERRPPLPLLRVSYLVSAWAGTVTDEHQLLGDVLTCFLQQSSVPAEHLDGSLPGPVTLALGDRDGRQPGELWSSLQGKLKPSFELEVTVPVDAAWVPAPKAVERVEGLVAPVPPSAEKATPPRRGDVGPARRSGTAVVLEGRPGSGS